MEQAPGAVAVEASSRINEEHMTNKQLAAVMCGGIDPCGSCSRPRACLSVYILVTLCRFDHKLVSRSYSGPFIPSERRHGQMEILRIQGRDIWTGFEIREYGRPHDVISVTLPEID